MSENDSSTTESEITMDHVPTVRTYDMFGATRYAAVCSCESDIEGGGFDTVDDALDWFVTPDTARSMARALLHHADRAEAFDA